MTEATIDVAARAVRARWPDGRSGLYPFLWLRDNCPSGFHPQTGEREADLLAVPEDIAPETVAVETDALRVLWVDGHESRFALGWLRDHRPGRPAPDAAEVAPTLWRGDLAPSALPRADATALMEDDAALLDWLIAGKRTGLALVDGLADDPEAGLAVARRVGFLRETNFGVTFDVVSKPDPNNLAYTAHALPLHTDLPNQELPPGFQFLHCVANAAEGGGSLFADGFALAEALRADDADAFAALRDLPAAMRFFDESCDIRRRAPVIRCGEDGGAREIRWNAHIASAFDLPAEALPRYYRAYRRFMALTRDQAFVVRLRLGPGEMVVFDNRRVLHGRDAFDPNTGRRFLRGCYVDRGEWDSRIRVLSRR